MAGVPRTERVREGRRDGPAADVERDSARSLEDALHGRAWSSLSCSATSLGYYGDPGRQATLRGGARSGHRQDPPRPQALRRRDPAVRPSFNTYASPTPVIEPGRVYVTFGSPGTAAIDTATGKVIWERRDFECNHYRGAGSSPVIFRDLLLLHYDGSDLQYVVALDKRTGKTVWKTPRSIDFKDLGPTASRKPKAICARRLRRPRSFPLMGRRCSSAWARRRPMRTIRSRGRSDGAWRSGRTTPQAPGRCSVSAWCSCQPAFPRASCWPCVRTDAATSRRRTSPGG